MEIYHGSSIAVDSPIILKKGFTKDFGYGFYCTEFKKQAERWAIRKGKGKGSVSIYEFNAEAIFKENLSILKFSSPCEDWLGFIKKCRSGEPHNYDIVEGPMADDVVANFITAYISGEITKEQFWALAKFRYPTHQLCFCSDKSLISLEYRGFNNVEI